ncbi:MULTISPECIES: aconitate hydratase [Halomonadaceae]|uniref:Aconitate hydratase n=1 Tax=Vreelandella piezotolerans TaxID=2609667 RepID=A0ABQ6X6D2_9GAMM|nr:MULTISPECIES: aconitate hydratase [Halomonas]KAE8437559.1 aconitate hydratase [Halomonas piezotolerans]MCG7590684.1 aconitate hydratase [Halomonas sp. McD50-5]MCG7616796.1 aconitate hydratase [Halomonas sp. McD50-4]QJA25563.1 aconitate hydratase [Halomonas piezotolerans]TNH18743.1 aconitate hydratase [Halomonas sp. BL6]
MTSTSSAQPLNLAQQLLQRHLVSGELTPGSEIALRIDQALLQDVLGTLVMLELEAMGLDRVHTEPSVQYIDHGLVQADNLNAETYLFLKSACERFGVWYSGPGNGISHPVHMENFGVPGQSIVGCDSHTTAAGALGMLAIGAGGIEVAMAMAGEPLYVTMPKIWGIKLEGQLPDWVSAKDIVLELLRRHGVAGGKNTMIEYYGPGLAHLSAMDRHVLANMGTEMGATATVFPSDEETRRFLASRGREADWVALAAEPGCHYDLHETLDLSQLEPMIALPSSPDNVVTVREAAGQPLHQAYIGSSGNPGFRDFAVVAEIVRGKQVADGVSLDINPSSRQVLTSLIEQGYLADLVASGARLHQAGCNGCIGMGQAPAVGLNSLRTVPRNFPGRSGTREDSVFLCSPETAAASAIQGVITDPRTLDMPYPRPQEPVQVKVDRDMFKAPLPLEEARLKALQKTDNTPALPELSPLPHRLDIPVLLVTGDNISTDDIMPAGQRVLPYWSSVYASAPFTFEAVDPTYAERADSTRTQGGHAIIGGANYGQGSSRENAALVPRYLGLQVVVAKSFARIHWQNLICFGALPLTFTREQDNALPAEGDRLVIEDLYEQLECGDTLTAHVPGKGELTLHHGLSPRQRELIAQGGVINHLRQRHA